MANLHSDWLSKIETTCGLLPGELKVIWDEDGESESEKECLLIYRRVVERANRPRAQLRQTIADYEAELATICSALGERPVLRQNTGNLKEELNTIVSLLEEIIKTKSERKKQFLKVLEQIQKISIGHLDHYSSKMAIDESDLSIRKLEDLHRQLQSLRKEKYDHQKLVLGQLSELESLCAVLGLDFKQTVHEVHPSLYKIQELNVSNDTIKKLASTEKRLQELKIKRIQMLQGLVGKMSGWRELMDTEVEEQQKFHYAIRNIAAPEQEITEPTSLSADIIKDVESEILRLKELYASKMKELVQMTTELEELCRQIHLVEDEDEGSEIEAFRTGVVDPSLVLEKIESQILATKGEALSRKDILESVKESLVARKEESWLEEYNRDEAGRVAHLELQRAENARAVVNNIPDHCYIVMANLHSDWLSKIETACGLLPGELKVIWDEDGESESEKECLLIYRRVVERANRPRAQLRQTIADYEAELATICSALGERPVLRQNTGTLKEELDTIVSLLEEIIKTKSERTKQFLKVLEQIIQKISIEIGHLDHYSSKMAIDESDLSIRKLGDLHRQLQSLRKEKYDHQKLVLGHLSELESLCAVLGLDFKQTVHEVHPSLYKIQELNVGNDTLASTVKRLRELKITRIQMLQGLVGKMSELQKLMSTQVEEQQKFHYAICNIAAPEQEITEPNSLSADIIKDVESEILRLKLLYDSKMKELVLKKKTELEELRRQIHLVVDEDEGSEIEDIRTGFVDPSLVLQKIESQILATKGEVSRRKDILACAEEWMAARREQSWLEEYNRDEAGRVAHLELQRAENARAVVNNIPVMTQKLFSGIKLWEGERGVKFKYDGEDLLSIVEMYISSQGKEQELERQRVARHEEPASPTVKRQKDPIQPTPPIRDGKNMEFEEASSPTNVLDLPLTAGKGVRQSLNQHVSDKEVIHQASISVPSADREIVRVDINQYNRGEGPCSPLLGNSSVGSHHLGRFSQRWATSRGVKLLICFKGHTWAAE